eukprot:8415333-Alexandrium_andersonii.AAC.1
MHLCPSHISVAVRILSSAFLASEPHPVSLPHVLTEPGRAPVLARRIRAARAWCTLCPRISASAPSAHDPGHASVHMCVSAHQCT